MHFTGEQGAAKSWTSRIVRALVDPNLVPLRSEPRDERDLMIAAKRALVVGFDNVSRISHVLSDTLARLATGGGFATRQLYTDSEEVLLNVRRPILLNGIGNVIVRPDLLDRTITLSLLPIGESERRTEADLDAAFARIHAGVLGLLLDGVARALATHAELSLKGLPRMADFARFAAAAMPAFEFAPDDFLRAYAENHAGGNTVALEASPVADVIQSLVRDAPFEGTATALLAKLNARAGESVRRSRSWPATARALSDALSRITPNLRGSVCRYSSTARGTQDAASSP